METRLLILICNVGTRTNMMRLGCGTRRTRVLYLAGALACLIGCSQQGPQQYELSGTVAWDGKPIPAGRIMLEPDPDAGVRGPRGVANITDGHYQTLPKDGIIGGPHVITILGADGKGKGLNPYGAPLFPLYTFKADLPETGGTLDFVVPKKR